MGGCGGDMQVDKILDYHPSNITLTKRYDKTTECQVQNAFYSERLASFRFARALTKSNNYFLSLTILKALACST